MGIFKLIYTIATRNLALFRQIAAVLKFAQSRELLSLLIKQPDKVGELLGQLGSKKIKQLNNIFNVWNKIEGSKPLKTLRSLTEQSDRAARKNVAQDLIGAAAKNKDSAALSSSWLVWGEFHPDPTGTVGSLTLQTKRGDSYTWGGVPSIVWDAMKKATGSHGSGAGSIFWTLFLRAHRVSPAEIIKSKIFQLAGLNAKPVKNPFANFGKIKNKEVK